MSETINPKKATDLFKEGVLAADAGENYTAEESFKNIHELGKSSSGTEYNLGVLYANESEYGKSIYHFHNAIFLNRFDKNYRESLAYVEKQVPNEFALIKNDYDHYLYQARSYVHAEEALLLSAVVLLFYFLGRSLITRKLWRNLLLTCTGLYIAVGIVFLTSKPFGVILNDVSLRDAPRESALQTRNLPSGSKVQILKDSVSFLKVRNGERFTGWVKKNEVGRLF